MRATIPSATWTGLDETPIIIAHHPLHDDAEPTGFDAVDLIFGWGAELRRREGEQWMSRRDSGGIIGMSGRLIWIVNFTGHTKHVDEARRLQSGIVSVLQTLQQHQMPATWMLPDPATSPRVSQEILGRDGQDVGLLADASWVNAGRNVLARELSRRAEASRIAGIPLQTMAAPQMDHDLDLLVRHRICAVQVQSPQTVHSSRRYGIWQVAATDRLPGRKGLWNGSLSYRRLIRNAVKQQQTILLTVDGDRVATDEKSHKLFQSVCRMASRQEGLAIRSFSEVGREILAVPTSTPARSILRAG